MDSADTQGDERIECVSSVLESVRRGDGIEADEDEVRTLRGVPALDDLHEVEHNLPRDEVRHRDRVLRVVC